MYANSCVLFYRFTEDRAVSRNIDLSGIKSFRKRLQALKSISNDDIVMAVAEKGKDIAQSRYGGDVVVSAESLGGGKAKIIASGEKVAFYEYGVGTQGEESGYQGNLPTEPITFESAGETHTTQGWQYNYPNPKTKKTVGDSVGWFYDGKFTDGAPAQAQMWKTANELQNGKAVQAVKELMKEKGVW